MTPKYVTDAPHPDAQKICISHNPVPQYGYDNKYTPTVKARFYIDEGETIIKIPGDISKLGKVNIDLQSDFKLVEREKLMNFKKL